MEKPNQWDQDHLTVSSFLCIFFPATVCAQDVGPTCPAVEGGECSGLLQAGDRLKDPCRQSAKSFGQVWSQAGHRQPLGHQEKRGGSLKVFNPVRSALSRCCLCSRMKWRKWGWPMQNWRQGWRSRKKSFHGWLRLFNSFEELSGRFFRWPALNREPALFIRLSQMQRDASQQLYHTQSTSWVKSMHTLTINHTHGKKAVLSAI